MANPCYLFLLRLNCCESWIRSLFIGAASPGPGRTVRHVILQSMRELYRQS
jgi:hypothetical protein